MGILLLVVLVFTVPGTVHAEENVIKVGYIGRGSVFEEDDGRVSGYTVDYLEEIAEYTGWEYEFISADWADCIEMLNSGELDLMGMVRYSEARDEQLLFSELSMASDHTILCAREDSDIYYQEYEAIDGCTVGVMEASIYEDAFLAHAQKHGLNCDLERFRSIEEAEEALLEGKIDLLATTRLARPSRSKLVDQFQMTAAYFVTGIQNRTLMQELDDAMQKLSIENGTMEDELHKKYYKTENESLPLTREEQEYLDSIDRIQVLGLDGRRPLGYTDKNGRFKGILVEYLNMLGTFSGIGFDYKISEHLLLEENAGVIEDEGSVFLSIDQSLEELDLENRIYKSDTLFETKLAYVKRQEDGSVQGRQDLVFALNSEMPYLEEMLHERSANYRVRYYDNSFACMDAVLNGEADITIQDEYVVTYLMQKPEFEDKLMNVDGEAYPDGMCLYAPKEHRHLISILNKTLDELSEEERANAIANAMLKHSYEYGLDDFLYEHKNWLRYVAVLVVLVVLLGIMLNGRINQSKKQKRENEKLQEKLSLDDLTGVYNRNGFFEKAREMVDHSESDICIVRINICHLKLINEMYGTEKGDYLLRKMGKGLLALTDEKKFVVGRFSADHFYLCIHREDFENIHFPGQVPSQGLGMNLSLTYGVYPVGTQKDIPVSAMCDRADMANSANKQSMEYIHYYSDEERQRQLREQEIENEMETAVAEHQFIIYIQPKYDIETEQIVGGEALVRWMHPKKGMIPPRRFIDLFERNGFVRDLDYYVWEECCRFLGEMKKKGLPVYPLSMNVSRIHFYSGGMKAKLSELLEKYGLDASDLELEVTETIYAKDTETVFRQCRELQQMGFKIAMDDFGSGYSCLNMLKEMPLDVIKMDMRFLSGGEDEVQVEKGRNILRSLIEMVHTLKLKVVVEGVETREHKAFIRRIGNCYAQGYYFSKPLDIQSYESLIETEMRIGRL